jgi:hypothetical protein
MCFSFLNLDHCEHYGAHCCRIFGFEGKEAEDITYVNWLSLLHQGVSKSLENYEPSTKTWLQVSLG